MHNETFGVFFCFWRCTRTAMKKLRKKLFVNIACLVSSWIGICCSERGKFAIGTNWTILCNFRLKASEIHTNLVFFALNFYSVLMQISYKSTCTPDRQNLNFHLNYLKFSPLKRVKHRPFKPKTLISIRIDNQLRISALSNFNEKRKEWKIA